MKPFVSWIEHAKFAANDTKVSVSNGRHNLQAKS
jgi:hypothetical protein